MTVIRCKICEVSLEVADNSAIAECEYCGIVQTLTKPDDAKKIALFDRANIFAQNFSKIPKGLWLSV